MWDRTSERSRRMRFHGHFDLNPSLRPALHRVRPDHEFALVATTGRGDDEQIVGVSRGDATRTNRPTPSSPRSSRTPSRAAASARRWSARSPGRLRAGGQAPCPGTCWPTTPDAAADPRTRVRALGHPRPDDRPVRPRARPRRGVPQGRRRGRAPAATAALTRFFPRRPSPSSAPAAPRRPSAGWCSTTSCTAGSRAWSTRSTRTRLRAVRGGLPVARRLPEVPDLVIVCVPARSSTTSSTRRRARRQGGVRDLGRVRRGRRPRAQARQERADGDRPGPRPAHRRPQLHGAAQRQPDVRMNGTFSQTFPARAGRVLVAVRGARASRSSSTPSARARAVDVRVGRQQGRHLRQRPAAVLGGRPDTDVILLYLESFGNPRKFSRIARRISRHKPIVAVKSGRTAAGRAGRVVAHRRDLGGGRRGRGAVPPGRRDPHRHARGAVRRRDAAGQPAAARGARSAILTNAGGPGILAADALRVQRPDRPEAVRRAPRAAPRVPPRRGRHRQPGRHDRLGLAGGYRHRRGARQRRRGRHRLRHLHPDRHTETDDVAAALVEAKAKLPGRPDRACSCRPEGIPTARRGPHPVVRLPRGRRPGDGPGRPLRRLAPQAARPGRPTRPRASTRRRPRRSSTGARGRRRGRPGSTAGRRRGACSARTACGYGPVRDRRVTAEEAAAAAGGVRRPGRGQGRRTDPQDRRRRDRARARDARTRSRAAVERIEQRLRRGGSRPSTPAPTSSRRWSATASRWSSASPTTRRSARS
jgi:acetate---CoA ligase (ADP-forming)